MSIVTTPINIKKTSIYLLFFRFLKIGFSILTLTLSAKYFGVSVEMDIWIIVSTAIATINLALWGPLNEIFRAKFVFMREEEGEETTLFKVRSLLLFILVITLFVSILLGIFSKSIIPYLAPSLLENDKQIFVMILLFMIPSFIINEMISIGTSVLNAYNVFYMPEIMGVISGLINLFCIILLAPHIGIMSLIVALYLSSFILLFFIIIYLRKTNIPLLSGGASLDWKYIKPFIYFALPFFLPYIISQFNNILEKNLSNNLGIGIVSIVNYASQFKGIIQAVFTSVLATVMVPSLAKYFANKNHLDFSIVFKENIQIVFISLSFIIPFLFGAAAPLANILYNHGGMDSSAIDSIIYLIRFYSISIISVMLYLIFGLTLLAQQKGYKYAIQGVISQIITIIINILFYKSIGPSIFPISLLISHFLVALIMYSSIDLENKKIVAIDLVKYILLILVLSGILYLLSTIINNLISNSILQLIAFAIILLVLFLFIGTILGFKVISYLRLIIFRINTFFKSYKTE